MSDNDEQLAFESAQKFANQYGGFLRACDALGKISSIKGAIYEAQQRLGVVKDEHAALLVRIEDDKAAWLRYIAQMKADGEKMRVDAFNSAKARVAEADNIFAEKNMEADKILADAANVVRTMIDDARVEGKRIIDELDITRADTAAAQNQLRAMRAEIEKQRTVLADVNGKITALRTSIGMN